MNQGRAMMKNCWVVLVELGHTMSESPVSRMTHLPLSKTRSARVLKIPGRMSISKLCFLPCPVIWRRTRIIRITLLPTLFQREVWMPECVSQHNFQWNLTFRPLKPGIQSKVWVRYNKVQGRLLISIRVDPRYLRQVCNYEANPRCCTFANSWSTPCREHSTCIYFCTVLLLRLVHEA